jgi:HlyD family secretion protein
MKALRPEIVPEAQETKRIRVFGPTTKRAFYATLLGILLFYVAWFYVFPTSVEGLRIVPAQVKLDITGPGLVDARNKVTITARIQGFLKTIAVDRNDPVEVGQILAQLESEDLFNQLTAAQADSEAAERAVSQARSDEERAKATAEKAKLDLERKRSLVQSRIITEADWVATEASFRQTQAELARSTTTIDRAIAQAASATANVEVLKARLNYATIRSPLDGVVVIRDRNVGDLLSPGTSLMQIVDPSTIIISARFDESVMAIIEAGQPATVRFASSRQDFKGTILRLIRQVDQETREFTVDITLERLPDHWAIGQRANVVIEALSLTPTIAIPQTFILRQNGRVGVWTLRHQRAEWVPLTLGYPAGPLIEVIDGLREGDIVLPNEGRFWLEPITVVSTAK